MTWLPQIEQVGDLRSDEGPYMSRIVWGRLRFHRFHRGDVDPDPHDHMWDFWTFPLVSYIEEVWADGALAPTNHVVRAFWPHHRWAEHRHRVIGRADGPAGPILTIVWTGRKRRKWGFWPANARWVEWWVYFGMREEPRRRASNRDPLRRPG